jgi:hypothetical protein
MGTNPNGSNEPDPNPVIGTFSYDSHRSIDKVSCATYDAAGRLISVTDACGEGKSQGNGLRSALSSLVHTFEFRLIGTEAQEQTLALGGKAGRAVVAIAAVRANLTRAGDAAAEVSPIGGIDVRAELRDGQAVCRAGLSEFAATDLIVVQVDVAVYLLR